MVSLEGVTRATLVLVPIFNEHDGDVQFTYTTVYDVISVQKQTHKNVSLILYIEFMASRWRLLHRSITCKKKRII